MTHTTHHDHCPCVDGGTPTIGADPLAHIRPGDLEPANMHDPCCGHYIVDYRCTRTEGHPGQHIAGNGGHVLAVAPAGHQPADSARDGDGQEKAVRDYFRVRIARAIHDQHCGCDDWEPGDDEGGPQYDELLWQQRDLRHRALCDVFKLDPDTDPYEAINVAEKVRSELEEIRSELADMTAQRDSYREEWGRADRAEKRVAELEASIGYTKTQLGDARERAEKAEGDLADAQSEGNDAFALHLHLRRELNEAKSELAEAKSECACGESCAYHDEPPEPAMSGPRGEAGERKTQRCRCGCLPDEGDEGCPRECGEMHTFEPPCEQAVPGPKDIDPRLLWALRGLGDDFGPLGVALAAAELTDKGLLRKQLSPGDEPITEPESSPWLPSIGERVEWGDLDAYPQIVRGTVYGVPGPKDRGLYLISPSDGSTHAVTVDKLRPAGGEQ